MKKYSINKQDLLNWIGDKFTTWILYSQRNNISLYWRPYCWTGGEYRVDKRINNQVIVYNFTDIDEAIKCYNEAI